MMRIEDLAFEVVTSDEISRRFGPTFARLALEVLKTGDWHSIMACSASLEVPTGYKDSIRFIRGLALDDEFQVLGFTEDKTMEEVDLANSHFRHFKVIWNHFILFCGDSSEFQLY